jgi:Ca2+/H+ antiporter, TMEM165/GDT1 family
MWRRRGEKTADPRKTKEPGAAPDVLRALATTFGVVFIAEWGDLTQLGTAALAAKV